MVDAKKASECVTTRTFGLVDLDGAGAAHEAAEGALPAGAGARGPPPALHALPAAAAQQPPAREAPRHVLDVLEQVVHCNGTVSSL